MVDRFLATPWGPLDPVAPEGPFYFHLGFFVLDFLQPKDPCRMCHLFSVVGASSGLAQTAVSASSLDSQPIGFPHHFNPKGFFSQL